MLYNTLPVGRIKTALISMKQIAVWLQPTMSIPLDNFLKHQVLVSLEELSALEQSFRRFLPSGLHAPTASLAGFAYPALSGTEPSLDPNAATSLVRL